MDGTADDADQLVKQLRKQLQHLTLERDDLQRDVENLCLQTGGSMWEGGSFVLSERLYSSEAEVRKLKRDMIELCDERDTYRDQVVEVKKAKSILDTAYREQLAKYQKLEQELAFYQTQSALAMADRDRMSVELDELRNSNIELQRQARDYKDTSETERKQRIETAKELARFQQQLQQASKDLEEKMLEAAVIPDLHKRISQRDDTIASLTKDNHKLEDDLAKANSRISVLTSDQSKLQQEVEQLTRELAEWQQQAEKAVKQAAADAAQHKAEVAELRKQLAASQQATEQTQQQLQAAHDAHEKQQQEAAGALAAQQEAATAAAQQAEARHAELQQQLQQQVALLHQKESRLAEVTKEKVDALVRLSQAQYDQSTSSSELEALRDVVSELKVRLAQATQEKVEALMKAAAAGGKEEAAAGAASVPAGVSPVTKGLAIPGRSSQAGGGSVAGSQPASPSGSSVGASNGALGISGSIGGVASWWRGGGKPAAVVQPVAGEQ